MDAIRTVPKDRRLLGRFTLLEKIGAGGYGEVWRAQDATLGIEVALKVLSPALARSETAWNDLLHEHEVAGLLDHPSILKVYTPQRDANTAVLPMELAPGGDLRRLRGGSYLQIIPVLLEIAAALEYAHEQGVIHRDLKPGNVLFDAENHALLADFGVAGAGFTAGRDRPRSGLSPFSASPEQLRGEEPAISDDIYGLGALAYELLAGQPPYYPHFDVRRVLEEPVDELRPVQPTPPQLVAIVMRMLDKNPRRRPLSMRAVIDEVDSTLNDTLHFEFDSTPEPQRSPREKIAARAAPPPTPVPAVERRAQPPPKIVAPTFERRAAPPPAPARAAAATKRPPPAAPPPPPPSRPPSVDRSAQVSASATDAVPPLGPAAKMQAEPLPWTFPNMVPASRLMRLEPVKARRWPWIALTAFVAIVVAGFFALPHEPPDVMALVGNPVSPTFAQPQPAAAPPAPSTADPQRSTARLIRARTEFDQQITALEARGADTWGGREFMSARLIAAEAVGAYDAGNPAFAEKRLAAAQEVLSAVQKRAPHEAALQLAAGERALAADRTQAAKQAFESALRIDPTNRKAQDALQRLRDTDSARAVIADAAPTRQPAEPVRAVPETARTATLDLGDAQGSSEPAPRERVAVAEDGYTRAVAAGSTAMGAGRLAEARAAFEKALSYNPNGHDAADGMAHVLAVLHARGVEGTHQRATALEAQERWDEALNEYEAALSVDPTLGYAQQGKVRSAARALLAQRLQALIDRPERLAVPEERRAAVALIASAGEQSPSGPVLRSQVARLQILLQEFDKLVQLALISDDATQIAIPSIGFRGTFARRVIELKPGKYTVIGTREGYREVRRDVTISPGAEVQTVSVMCGEPI